MIQNRVIISFILLRILRSLGEAVFWTKKKKNQRVLEEVETLYFQAKRYFVRVSCYMVYNCPSAWKLSILDFVGRMGL